MRDNEESGERESAPVGSKSRCSSGEMLNSQSCVFVADVLVLKHESKIIRQWSDPVSGSRMSQAISPGRS